MTQTDQRSFQPSALSMARSFERKPFAVFVHVFYLDVWERIIERLEATVEEPFHLIVTAPHAIADGLPLPASRLLASSQIIPCENRGRDVRPFHEALRRPLDFDVGLKLHTKRSLHRLDGGDWGQTLVDALLPDDGGVRQIHDAMTHDPRLALVAPDGMLVSQRIWMQGNRTSMQTLGNRLSLDLDRSLKQTPVFIAGTMFWFRKEALRLFIETPLDDLFEVENGQVDGTAAHALERWIAPIAERQGGVTTTVKGLFSANRDMTNEQIRRAAHLLADQPNPFLVPLGFFGKVLASSLLLRTGYMSLPMTWRRQIKRWLLPRSRGNQNENDSHDAYDR